MQVTLNVHPDVFILLPVIAFGRVGEDGENGVGIGWLFWLVTVCFGDPA